MWYSPTYLALILLLTKAVSSIGQHTQGIVNDIKFISKTDRTAQYYVEILPEGFDKERRYDLLIGLHGHGADRWQFVKENRGECLAFRTFAEDHGMIAISPDYRAKTSWMGPAAENDLLQILSDVRKQYRISRVFLVGGSMGGTSALTFAALHPDLLDGVVALNGHVNHLEYSHFQDAIAASFGGNKSVIPEEYKRRSAEYWPERLTMPLAFTVGMADTLVPPASVIRLVNVLRQLNREVRLDRQAARGHETNFDDSYAAIEYVVSNTLKRDK